MKLFQKYFRSILVITTVLITASLTGCGNDDSANSSNASLKEAKQYLAQGKIRHALIKTKESLQKTPESADARLMLATLYLKQNQPSSAEIEIRKSIQYGANRNDWLPILGQALVMQSLYNKLLEDIKPEPEDEKQTLSIISQLQAEAYIGKEDYLKARQFFLEAQTYDSQQMGSLIGLARMAIIQKNITLALDYIQEILAKDPKNMRALLLMGDIYFKYGKLDEAYNVINQALAVFPSNPVARLKRATIELSRKNTKAAEEDIKQVLKQYPALPLANYLDARIYFLKGNMEKAYDLLQEVFRVNSNLLPAHLLNGLVSLQRNSDRQAERSFRIYLAANPDSRMLTKLLAITQLRLGTPGQVVKMLTTRKNRWLQDQEARILLGLAYLQMDKFDEARQTLLIAVAQKSILIENKREKEVGPKKPLTSKEDIYDQNILLRDVQLYNSLLSGTVDSGARALIKHGAVKAENYYMAGLLMAAYNKPQKAQQYFLEAINRKPQLHEAEISLAKLLMVKKQWQEAEEILLNIPEQSEQTGEAKILLVKLYESSGNHEKAVNQLITTWNKNKESPALGLTVFKYYLQQKEFHQADKIADELVREFPGQDNILQNIALLYKRAGLNDKAINTLNKKSKKTGNGILSQMLLALLYAESGKAERAEEIYKTQLDKHPKNLLVLQSLSQFYIKQNKPERAMETVDEIVLHYPDNAGAYQLKGWLVLQSGDREKALQLYKHAYDLKPTTTLTILYAKTLVQNGAQDEAIYLLRNWLFIRPQAHAARLILANIYQQDHEISKAITEYLILEESDNYKQISLNNLSLLLLESGDDRLTSYLQKLVDTKTTNPGIMDTIGWVYLQTGQPDKAEPYLKEAATRLKNVPTVKYHLAVYYQKTGNIDKARTILTNILSGNTPFQEKGDAQKLLDSL
ncbi:MAG TPA: tetratricopeptide repeat protein [Gammaproteobacteria bacterium]|nr:tetratricopeptide repeat protein [Gammaproteobacteria bacterium]